MNKQWSSDEDGELRRRYVVDGAEVLSRDLGRSLNAVYCRVRHLGLHKARSGYEATIPGVELIAYTAGLLDGEGSVQLNPGKNKAGGRSYWCLTVQIATITDDLLENLRLEWGNIGHVITCQNRNGRLERTVKYWRIYAAKAGWFLSTLLPYLRIKKEHAEIALAFRKVVASAQLHTLTAEEMVQRQALGARMRILNARTGRQPPLLPVEAR